MNFSKDIKKNQHRSLKHLKKKIQKFNLLDIIEINVLIDYYLI